jgi:hypothetical protein
MKADEKAAETPRELGTEDVDGRRYEVRPDGSYAYFGQDGDEEVDRELAEAGIPAREVGTPKEDK